VTGVQFQRCLRAFDDEGRFAPEFDSNNKVTVDCDTVIITIGQAVELDFIDSDSDGIKLTERGLIEADSESRKKIGLSPKPVAMREES